MFIVPIQSMIPAQKPEDLTSNNTISYGPTSKVPFSDFFEQAINNVIETQAISEQDAYDLALGNVDDLHTVIINSEIAATALELTVQLTNRAIGAYNEIIRMQI